MLFLSPTGESQNHGKPWEREVLIKLDVTEELQKEFIEEDQRRKKILENEATGLPDIDDAGRKGMHIIASEIVKVAKSVRWLELPDLPEKGDLSDWLNNPDNDKKVFEILVTNAPQWDPNYLHITLADPELGERLNILNSVDEIWLEPQEITPELLPVDIFYSEISSSFTVE